MERAYVDMAKRKPISKALRFEVFKRDSFTCQYCGRSAPDVVLQVDHIQPVSKGGQNDILNLITSCRDCNLGKGAKKLDDNTAIVKIKKQLDEVNERREQLEMLMQWKNELLKIREQELDDVCDYWAELVDPYSLNENGRIGMKKLLYQFTTKEVLDAIDIACNSYLKYVRDSKNKDSFELEQESVEYAFSKIGGICYNRRKNNAESKEH